MKVTSPARPSSFSAAKRLSIRVSFFLVKA
jgi:hypothetical protein